MGISLSSSSELSLTHKAKDEKPFILYREELKY